MRLSSYLKAKIHHARVTKRDKNYIGSIGIGKDLMDLCGIKNGEQVHIWAVDCPWFHFFPARIVTYAFEGPEGEISINGGGAYYFEHGQRVIIAAFDIADEPIEPVMIKVNSDNRFEKYLTFNDVK